MNVNVVTVRSGWILQKIAERIVEAGEKSHFYDWSLSHNPHPHADVNFYCDIQNCYQGPVGSSKHIGLFTHVHANDPTTVQQNVTSLDFIFHMAPRYMVMFNKQFNYPNERMDIMVPYEPRWEPRRLRIGIFQRGKFEGKGFNFIYKFIQEHPDVCEKFEWFFMGDGWRPVVNLMDDNNIRAHITSDAKLQYPEGYEEAYSAMDYVLIPSLWEGGPIAALEAAASGVPLISSNVGWADSWADYLFKPNDLVDLRRILHKISSQRYRKSKKLSIVASYGRCVEQILGAYRKIR